MPKTKTRRSVMKRFKVTATGKIVRRKALHSHILTKKTTARKRRLRHPDLIAPSDRKRVRTYMLI